MANWRQPHFVHLSLNSIFLLLFGFYFFSVTFSSAQDLVPALRSEATRIAQGPHVVLGWNTGELLRRPARDLLYPLSRP